MDSTTDPHEAMAQAWAFGVAYFEVQPPEGEYCPNGCGTWLPGGREHTGHFCPPRGPHELIHPPTGRTAMCGGPGRCVTCDGDLCIPEGAHNALVFEFDNRNAGVDNTRSEQVVSTAKQSPPRGENLADFCQGIDFEINDFQRYFLNRWEQTWSLIRGVHLLTGRRHGHAGGR